MVYKKLYKMLIKNEIIIVLMIPFSVITSYYLLTNLDIF